MESYRDHSCNYPVYLPFDKQLECKPKILNFPPQHQHQQPGLEYKMVPRPIYDDPCYKASGKLQNKVAIVLGGDSGIGRAVSVCFAKEGAQVIVIVYLNEHQDAEETKRAVQSYGSQCILLSGDLRKESFCENVIELTMKMFQKIDILVLNQGVQFPQDTIEDITKRQLFDTFETNLFPLFYIMRFASPYLQRGARVICTASITAYNGKPNLLDYSSTKGAIVSFTRSLAKNLASRGINVNAIAPGPTWTPLIVSSYNKKQVSEFGSETLFKRAAQPFELAPTYVYLASRDSAFVTGQVLHVDGGASTAS